MIYARRSTMALGLLIGFSLFGGCSQNDGPMPTHQHSQHAMPAAQSSSKGAPLFDDLGNHHYPITTSSPQAQKYFDQGLTLCYSFNHPEAIRSFTEAARLDPRSPMPWWGVALAYGPNINRPMEESDVPKAWEALQRARQLAGNGSAKERAYIDALTVRYAQNHMQDRSALDLAYANAMRELAGRYRDDLDAATLFAEALMDTMPWDYWTPEGQPKPATREVLAALERVLQTNPNHPGATHYYIHAVEAGQPKLALQAADRLRDLVPGAGHMVHMPAHIYLRLGLYQDASRANELASAADESYFAQCNAQGFYPATYYPHNVHFLWYTYAMEGRSRDSIEAARKVLTHVDRHPGPEAQRLRPLLAMALVRFGQWDEILRLPAANPQEAYYQAIWLQAQGLAQVGKGNLTETQRHLDALQRITSDPASEKFNTATFPGWSLMRIAAHDLAGHVALARSDHEKAITEFRAAVDLEKALPYMEPPFSYMPMRHALGNALLKAGRAPEAERVFRDDLDQHPNNGWALVGLAQSLRAQNRNDQAEQVDRQRNQTWIRADIEPVAARL